MKLYNIRTGLLNVNTYFLVDEKTNECLVIDCGEYLNKLEEAEKKNKFKITKVLLTHAHFDHSGCGKKLQDRGVKIYISQLDAPKLSQGGTLSEEMGKQFESFIPDGTFSDNDEINFNGINIKVISTPGHTDGSCTFIVGNMLFTGDTLFLNSYGRCDFATGSYLDMKNSLQKLFNLSGDYKVYPGHNEFTTLNAERKNNLLKTL